MSRFHAKPLFNSLLGNRMKNTQSQFKWRVLFLVCLVLCGSSTAPVPAGDALTSVQYRQRGWQAFQRGAFEQAIVNWQEAVSRYAREDKSLEQCDVFLQLAEAYQALGRYSNATENLHAAWRLASQVGDGRREAIILGSLGGLAAALGQYSQAEQYLNRGLVLSRELNSRAVAALILNALGNLAVAQHRDDDAITAYGASLALASSAKNRSLMARARINQASVLVRINQHAEAKTQLDLPLPISKTFRLLMIGPPL
jgi:tetratricopeptide (TPR) repeat protein